MRRLLLGLALASLPAVAALAHHGWGSYDASKPVTVAGPIETLEIRAIRMPPSP